MACEPPGGLHRKCGNDGSIQVWNVSTCRYDTAMCSSGFPCFNGWCVPSQIIPQGATHVFSLQVWRAFPWSSDGATAITKILDNLRGYNVNGWEFLDATYYSAAEQIYIFFKKTGSPTIPPVLVGITIVLLALGVIIVAYNFSSITGSIIATVDNTLRGNCIKSFIDQGKTPEEAISLCPEKSQINWTLIALGAAAILGTAYVLGRQK